MKQFWEKKNPNKSSRPLSPKAKAYAEQKAKAAGRPYPNLVDNSAAKQKFKMGVY